MRRWRLERRMRWLLLAVAVGLGSGSSLCEYDRKIVVGTVQTLSGQPFNTWHLTRAYRFWAEYTNEHGGFMINGSCFHVALQVRDDQNNATRRLVLLKELAEAGAHVLFGGHTTGTDDLALVAGKYGLPALTPALAPDDAFMGRPMLFGVAGSPEEPQYEFLQRAQRQGASRVALLANSGVIVSIGACAAARTHAHTLGLEVVYEGSYSTTAPQSEHNELVADMMHARPDMLVACSLEYDSLLVARALIANDVLLGAIPPARPAYNRGSVRAKWEGSIPAFVSSKVLRFVFISTGPGRETNWRVKLGAYAHGFATTVMWHHELDPGAFDPYFGSASEVTSGWARRSDFGNGEVLGWPAAAAITAGVVFRAAVEAAGTVDGYAVAAKLRAHDAPTFFGRVRFGKDIQVNVGRSPNLIQWWCDHPAGTCASQVVKPHEEGGRLRPYDAGCPIGRLLTLAVDGRSYTCERCFAADPVQMFVALNLWRHLVTTPCPVFKTDILLRSNALPGDEKKVSLGMQIAVLTARTLDTILPNVPIRFLSNASSEPRGRLAPMVLFDDSGPWPRVAVEVDGVTVSLTPDETVQGRAMALIIAQFQWGRTQIVRCRSERCERMKSAFTAELIARSPGERSFSVVGEVALSEPPGEEVQGGAARRAWEDALLKSVAMDCARTRIMVLMVDTKDMAEAVFNAAGRARWGDHAVVFIGSYETTAARNVPRGMLGLRPATNDLPVGVLLGIPSKKLWDANQGLIKGAYPTALAWDAVSVYCFVLNELLRARDILEPGANATAEAPFFNKKALDIVDFLSGSGRVVFGETGTRCTGILQLLNSDGKSFLPIMEIEVLTAQSMTIFFLRNSSLGAVGKAIWEDEAVIWPWPEKGGRGKPPATCPCVFADNSWDVRCIWSGPAIAVLFVGVLLSMVACAACAVPAILRWQEDQEDALWRVDVDELVFAEPVEIVGRGTFGYVIKADFRGTTVAVKRVLPPRGGSVPRSQGTSPGMESRESSMMGSMTLPSNFGANFGSSFSIPALAPIPVLGGAKPSRASGGGSMSSPTRTAGGGDIRGGGGDIRGGMFGDGVMQHIPLLVVHPSVTLVRANSVPPKRWAAGSFLRGGAHSSEPSRSASGSPNRRAPSVESGSASRRGAGPGGRGADTSKASPAEMRPVGFRPWGMNSSGNLSVRLSAGNMNTAASRGSSGIIRALGAGFRSIGGSSGSDSGMHSAMPSNAVSESTYLQLQRNFSLEMRQLAKLRHPCIIAVMGAVVKKGCEPMLVMEYMDHGSLFDVLHNETVELEPEMVLSIIRDVAKGVRFLHANEPCLVHADLKAANVLVDLKFNAKVADFGLTQKRGLGGGAGNEKAVGSPLWMAPELLRGESGNTSASDVFAFGVMLAEVFSREEPYVGEDMGSVLEGVSSPTEEKRPVVAPDDVPPAISLLMVECWAGAPARRPPFAEIDRRLQALDYEGARPPNHAEKAKRRREADAQRILSNVFPPHVAEALSQGRRVEPEHHDLVTIFFSDIVGFTDIVSTLSPKKTSDMLDRLYSAFDGLCRKLHVFKVETVGDAYMAVTNLVEEQAADHTGRIAEFAMAASAAAEATLIDLDDPSVGTVRLRIGFHSGPVVANVIGSMNQRFCLFGDTVNTASRMETTSAPGRIHCSMRAATLLAQQSPGIPLLARGSIVVKGKGEMETFWVNEGGSSAFLLSPPPGVPDDSAHPPPVPEGVSPHPRSKKPQTSLKGRLLGHARDAAAPKVDGATFGTPAPPWRGGWQVSGAQVLGGRVRRLGERAEWGGDVVLEMPHLGLLANAAEAEGSIRSPSNDEPTRVAS